IFEKTKLIFNRIEIDNDQIDNVLKSLTVGDISSHFDTNATNLLKQVLNQEEIEKVEENTADVANLTIQENCEVRLKRFIPINENDIVSLEKSLYILGRVFKNADDITNTDFINEIFDYIINTTIAWGYKLFQSFKGE